MIKQPTKMGYIPSKEKRMTEMSSPKLSDEEKYDAFARAVAADPKKAAGRICQELGYWNTDPYKQASRLKKMPQIQELIRKYEIDYQTYRSEAAKGILVAPQSQVQKQETLEEVFSTENIVTKVKQLPPDKFIKAFLDYQKGKIDEDLGDYDGLSIGDLISEANTRIDAIRQTCTELERYLTAEESE
jgi:hypothetical protein